MPNVNALEASYCGQTYANEWSLCQHGHWDLRVVLKSWISFFFKTESKVDKDMSKIHVVKPGKNCGFDAEEMFLNLRLNL